jgi:HAE1 family hydrophobic/amphiphilic exporter-1
VVLTTYVFLQNWRTTIIPAVTIPVSLVGTFAVMLALGLSINTLTLFGLVLAIGIVVDDAIVVVENTMRHIDEEKLSGKEAAVRAMGEVTGPVIATTLALLAVFVPTAMIPGITGRLYRQFALTISTATVFSSINALTLSPALCGVLLKPTPEKRGPFFRAFNWLFRHTTNGYMGIVRLAVRRTVVVAVLFAAVLALTVLGIKVIPRGFIPDEDQGYFMIQAELPDGATVQRTRAVLDRIAGIAKTTPGVAHTISVGGLSILTGSTQPNAGVCFVVLKPWDDRTDPALHASSIVAGVQERIFGIQEAICLAFGPPPIHGLGSASGFEFELEDRGGAGLELLEAIGDDIVHAGTSDPVLTRMHNSFQANVPQLFLDIDRVKAKRLDIDLSTIFGTLQAYLGSYYVNDFTLFDRNYRVIIQADAEFRSRIADIKRLKVRDKDGHMIPLSTLLTIRDTVGPQMISRYNLYPSASITGQAMPGYSSGQAAAAMSTIAERLLPPSMGYEWTGVIYEQIKAGNVAPLIFSLGAVFVFLVLAAQYESWSTPLAVILSVPVAIFGALLGTWLRGFDNNIYTQIGLVLLIGLASKYAILIVEFAKQRHDDGLPIRDAAIEASRLRFRPLIMTALSFVLGVSPLVVAGGAGAAARRCLGTASFAGTIAATVLGVLLVPVLYVVIQGMSERLRGVGKTGGSRSASEEAARVERPK